MYKKILVTHDGSKLASTALPHAALLAKACNAEVIVLHVVETIGQEVAYLDPTDMAYNVGVPAAEIVKDDEKLAEEQLQRIKTHLQENGIKEVKTLIANGFAGTEIIITANGLQCDLIIMSTHGRSGLGRMLLGSVADDVIRHAKCPVLVVHPTK